MKKILYLSCILFFCGYVFSQEAKPCPGVLINGVCWAKSNVDKPGTFASTPEAFGMLYQWNRKKAWPHNTEATGWDNTNAPGDYWETINNPCPKGWRVPNEEEINSIKDCDYVSENYICKFTDPNSGNTMVIPRTSRRNERGEYSEDYIWCYWVISAYNQYYAFTISNVPYIRLRELPKNWGLPVRCVADWNVQECEDKEEEVEVTIDKNKLPYTWRDTVFQEGTMSGTYIFRRIQALTGCDSIVTLKLTVKSECDKPCPGVLINGVCWAKSNVDKPGTFAPTPESWGMLYQWNRKKAWAHNTDTTGWDDTYAAGDYWEAINDPCPTGWRVPKEEEINSIIDCDYVNENYIYKFTDPNSGNTIIMPYTPTRWQGGRWVNGRGAWDYWFASAHNDVDAYSTTPTPFIRLISLPKKWAHPVRCVADWNVPECEEIKRDTSVTICAKDLPYDFCDTTFEEGTMSGTYVFQRIQALTGCDSIVTLKLTVTQEAKPIDPQCYPGVLIDGVFWSEYNVDAPGTFTPTPEAFGMFYQWNSNVPIAHGETMRIKDITEPVWEDANNPCPDGWRIPTLEETERLFSSSSQRVQKNGINGWEFKNEMTGKTIFIPIAGYWYIDHVGCENEDGDYWTSYIEEIHPNPLYQVYHICLTENTNIIDIFIPRAASVRCVRDRLPGIECSERDTFVTICEKELPYPFADTVFGEGTVSGIYTFHRSQSVTGYDSIVHLHLTVQEIPPLEFFGEICQGGNYTENDFNLYAVMRDTIVRDTIPTQRGCDSVRILDLRVHPRYDTVVYDTVCQGDPYHGHGFTLTDAQPSDDGTSLAFHRTAQSIHGCDSVIHLYLFVGKTYLFETGREICQGDTVMWRGKQYDTEGTYEEPFITVHGCDSVYRLHLTVHPSPRLEFFGEVCQGKSYNEDGFFVPSATKDTIVRQELKTRWGCDSVRTLYLTVHPVYETIVYDTVCEGDPYHGYGFTLTNAQPSGDGTSLAFHRTAQSIHGCDSVIHLNLFVGETYLFETEREICQGDTVMWRGKSYDKEGRYEEPFITVHGCDSVYRLRLTVHPSPRLEFFGEVCQGKSYNEDGFFVPSATKDTIVRQELKTRWNCDSVRTLYLTVHPVYDTIVRDTVCQGDAYYRHGVSISYAQPSGDGKPAMYRKTYPSIHGCDSIVTLFLTVHPISDTILYDAICRGDGYRNNGFSLDAAQFPKGGTYTFNRKERNLHGCDSTIHLSLTVHPDYLFPRAEHICEGETFEFRDKLYTASGFYTDTLATVHGCDSVYTLSLTVDSVYDVQLQGVLCEGEEYVRDGFRVKEPGTHVLHLRSVHGCDSTVTLTLTEEKKVEGSIGFLLEDCTRHGYGFEFSPSIPVREWVWDMGDGTAYRTEEGYHRYADSGIYRVLLRTLTDNGCGNEFLHVQRVPPYLDRVTVHADRQVVDEEYPTVRFRAEVLPGMECEWDFGDGTTGKGSETEHTYATAEARTYAVTLRVTNRDGCITEEEVTVEAVVFPKAVNTFSPNGDGINDVFMAGFRIEVMNRNGLKIYSGGNGWDGIYKGGEAKEDTYFYRVTFRTATGERTKTGYVNLIR